MLVKFLEGKATESLGPEMREWVAAEAEGPQRYTVRLLFYVVKSSDDRWGGWECIASSCYAPSTALGSQDFTCVLSLNLHCGQGRVPIYRWTN